MTASTEHHTLIKTLTAFFAAVLAAVIGYLAVYWWVFGNFSDVLNVSVLKNQIISQRQASNVKEQLRELGYEIEDKSFFHLSSPNTSNYHADVLGGYEPVSVEEEEGSESYYFYDSSGKAYFFEVGEGGEVDPKNFVPLIQE